MHSSVIQLWNGERFDLLDPDPAVMNPEVIAHALANLCRFNGHVLTFYSVAEHSIMVSEEVPHVFAMAGLMHDAAEAFIGDVTSPLKHMLPDLKVIENRIMQRLGERYKFDPCIKIVKWVDRQVTATEKRDLMYDGTPWEDYPRPLDRRIKPTTRMEAFSAFIRRFTELGGDWGPSWGWRTSSGSP